MLSHKTTYRVRYADTDKMGFVYHANYLRWFEIGRSELFRHMGLSYKEIEAHGFFLPVSEVHIKFMTPSQYDDILVIETILDAGIKAVVQFDYNIYGEDKEKILVKGYTRHACLDRSGRVVRPPEILMDVIKNNSNPS